MTTTKLYPLTLWFIESNDYDDVLVSINIDTPFEEEGDSHKQLELFTTEEQQQKQFIEDTIGY